MYGHLKELLEITKTLRGAQIEFAICGGIAVALHGYIRYTKDIDLLILTSDLDRCKAVLGSIGYDFSSGLMPFKNTDGTFRSVVRISKIVGEDFMVIDLLLAENKWKEIFEDRERIMIEDHSVDVVSKDGLIAMKKMAGRSQDLADIHKLLGHED